MFNLSGGRKSSVSVQLTSNRWCRRNVFMETIWNFSIEDREVGQTNRVFTISTVREENVFIFGISHTELDYSLNQENRRDESFLLSPLETSQSTPSKLHFRNFGEIFYEKIGKFLFLLRIILYLGHRKLTLYLFLVIKCVKIHEKLNSTGINDLILSLPQLLIKSRLITWQRSLHPFSSKEHTNGPLWFLMKDRILIEAIVYPYSFRGRTNEALHS